MVFTLLAFVERGSLAVDLHLEKLVQRAFQLEALVFVQLEGCKDKIGLLLRACALGLRDLADA